MTLIKLELQNIYMYIHIYLKNRPVDGARVKDLPLVVTTAFYCLIMFF